MKYHLSRHEINKRCAELLGLPTETKTLWNPHKVQNYCQSWQDAGPIIEKCWIRLMEFYGGWNRWDYIMHQYECTQLEAACICFLESNDDTP